ncbi:tyrosine-type recombinase/integrase [Enterobacter mori]|uniref:tyrosine-type recombinase/integrase n=1 Tax=Enterobacter mori TaxID=539813 RepID=UPI003B840E95
MALTVAEVKGLLPREKRYEVFDGRGLLLCVLPTGSKSWRFRYSHPVTKLRQTITIGPFPEFTLSEAREYREEFRRMVSRGLDPIEQKKTKADEEKRKYLQTFSAIAIKWEEVKKLSNKRENTLKAIKNVLHNHLIPIFGSVNINDLTPSVAIKGFERLDGKPALREKAISMLNEVMNYAINCGVINVNPLSKIKTAFSANKAESFAALDIHELPYFIKRWSESGQTQLIKYGLLFQMLTMTRPSEMRWARWSEIDMDAGLWVIPAERMKGKIEHHIPLSSQALSILIELKKIKRGDYVFYSQKVNKPISHTAIFLCLKRLGFAKKITQHGFRAMWSTLLNEEGFNPDVIEAALAHKSGDAVRNIYNRTTYFEQRRIMMQWVGDFFENASKGIIQRSGGHKGLRVVNE